MIGANQTAFGGTDRTDRTDFLYPSYVCVRACTYRGGTRKSVLSVLSVLSLGGLECGA